MASANIVVWNQLANVFALYYCRTDPREPVHSIGLIMRRDGSILGCSLTHQFIVSQEAGEKLYVVAILTNFYTVRHANMTSKDYIEHS
jgi:hypothetical protein